MSNVYGGLVSRPYNRIDTDSRGSVTYTYNGTVINGSAGDAVEVGGGDTPTPPTTAAVQIYADNECTTRPSAGVQYQFLYAKFNRGFGLNDAKTWGSELDQWGILVIETPTTQYPQDNYSLDLYESWHGSFENPIGGGAVLVLENAAPEEDPLPSSFTVDFYDE